MIQSRPRSQMPPLPWQLALFVVPFGALGIFCPLGVTIQAVRDFRAGHFTPIFVGIAAFVVTAVVYSLKDWRSVAARNRFFWCEVWRWEMVWAFPWMFAGVTMFQSRQSHYGPYIAITYVVATNLLVSLQRKAPSKA